MKKIALFLAAFMLLGGVAMGSQVLVIKAETAKDGLQYIGDVVAVYPDTHIFSPTELDIFDVLTIGGTVDDVKARLQEIQPVIAEAFYLSSSGKWSFVDDGTATDFIDVVQNGNKWYRVDNDFKFPISVGELTPEEKQILETVDINHPSVDSFINKLAKDIFSLSGNDVEITDLKNQEP